MNKERAHALLGRFATTEQTDAAFDALKDHWRRLLSTYSVTSTDEKLDRMVNIWNQYQCMVTFNMSRSASFFETGIGRGMGFRDSNQDLLGFVHLIPERARERILDIAATQFPDGSAYHQYQPLTKRGNDDIGSGFNDDPLWLIAGVAAYIKETGDFGILDEVVPFDNDDSLAKPLFEHLTRSFEFTVTHRGPHGLPLIGRADWNDCLNLNCFSTTPGESFQTTENQAGGVAESVFIAAQFVLYGAEYAALAERRGLPEVASQARKVVDEVRQAVLDHGWDGDWFLRAYDFYGNPVGTAADTEGRIWIEPQGFAIMAGIGIDDGRAAKALDSVEEHLATPHGMVLQSPAYTTYRIELGEVSTYPPGYKENGGIFCHNNPWVIIAETMVGRGDRAFDHYKRITPAYREEISDVHRVEPYVYAQMIAGKEAVRHGEAKNSWLTGTAAWNFVAVSQHLLGVRPDYDGLIVDPQIGSEVPEFTVTRVARGATYVIHVTTRSGDELAGTAGGRRAPRRSPRSVRRRRVRPSGWRSPSDDLRRVALVGTCCVEHSPREGTQRAEEHRLRDLHRRAVAAVDHQPRPDHLHRQQGPVQGPRGDERDLQRHLPDRLLVPAEDRTVAHGLLLQALRLGGPVGERAARVVQVPAHLPPGARVPAAAGRRHPRDRPDTDPGPRGQRALPAAALRHPRPRVRQPLDAEHREGRPRRQHHERLRLDLVHHRHHLDRRLRGPVPGDQSSAGSSARASSSSASASSARSPASWPTSSSPPRPRPPTRHRPTRPPRPRSSAGRGRAGRGRGSGRHAVAVVTTAPSEAAGPAVVGPAEPDPSISLSAIRELLALPGIDLSDVDRLLTLSQARGSDPT